MKLDLIRKALISVMAAGLGAGLAAAVALGPITNASTARAPARSPRATHRAVGTLKPVADAVHADDVTVTLPGPVTTITVPGPTTTATVTAPGPTTTVTATVTGPTTTRTVTGPTTTRTVTGPTTTVTKTVTGPTTTKTATGPTTTVTKTVTVVGAGKTVTSPATTVTGPGGTSTVTVPGATSTVTTPAGDPPVNHGRTEGASGYVAALMSWEFYFSPSYSTVKVLNATGLKSGMKVSVSCRGRGCPFHRHVSRIATHCHTRSGLRACRTPHTMSLHALFRGRHLRIGSRIEVTITHTHWIGKFYEWKVRRGRVPKSSESCLAPGSSRPGVHCTGF